jgi:hypothetical protein
MRRRDLRLDGITIGEIDAVAAKGGVALLISCKSTVYSQAYDQGRFQTIRNARTMVERAVDRWRDLIGRLETRRQGDNFDLTAYERVIGVVVTPHVLYVEPPLLDEYATDGLRWSSSSNELISWLRGGEP